MIAFVLWILGLFLIFLEFFLPGAILGIGGGILIAISIFVFVDRSESPISVVLYLLGVVVSIVLVIKFALWRIRTQKPEKGIRSDASQDGFIASKFDRQAIGKQGVVLTDLKPGGYILVDGKQHQAISLTGYITKGDEVIVLGGQEESLLVKSITKEQPDESNSTS